MVYPGSGKRIIFRRISHKGTKNTKITKKKERVVVSKLGLNLMISLRTTPSKFFFVLFVPLCDVFSYFLFFSNTAKLSMCEVCG